MVTQGHFLQRHNCIAVVDSLVSLSEGLFNESMFNLHMLIFFLMQHHSPNQA